MKNFNPSRELHSTWNEFKSAETLPTRSQIWSRNRSLSLQDSNNVCLYFAKMYKLLQAFIATEFLGIPTMTFLCKEYWWCLASLLVNADWSISPETRILKRYLNYPIGELSGFLFPLDRRQVPSLFDATVLVKVKLLTRGRGCKYQGLFTDFSPFLFHLTGRIKQTIKWANWVETHSAHLSPFPFTQCYIKMASFSKTG